MPRTVEQRTKVNQVTLNEVIDDVGEAANKAAADSAIEEPLPKRICPNIQDCIFDCLNETPAEVFALQAISSGDAAQFRLELL